jgi:hypothetical protein
MKIFFAVFAAVVLTAAPALTQEFDFSGEVRTGVYWKSEQEGDAEAVSKAEIHNTDDAGTDEGRLRLNFHYQRNNIGVKIRFQETQWGNGSPTWSGSFPIAHAYGNFLNDQLLVSAGRLGYSPWAMGGDEGWTELDAAVGIRTEIKPAPIPGLNIGFVLNEWNNAGVTDGDRNIGSLLQESVLGASYDHGYFGLRFAYRLDSKGDKDNTSSGSVEEVNEGEELIYRLEEQTLKNLLPGFRVWANGHYQHINSPLELAAVNWLYVQYAPDPFTAQLRFGYQTAGKKKILHAKGSFYYNILSFLSAGALVAYAQDYEIETSPGSPFSAWHVEPKVKVNLSGFYVEFVYHYGSEYVRQDVEKKTNWINLRLVYTF